MEGGSSLSSNMVLITVFIVERTLDNAGYSRYRVRV